MKIRRVNANNRRKVFEVAAEFQTGDIDPRSPERGADRSYDAGNVAVVQHQEVTLGRGLDTVAVNADEPDCTVTKHRSCDFMRTPRGFNRDRQGVGIVDRPSKT